MTFTGDMRYETSKSTLVRARLEALIADPVAAGEEQGYVARAPHRFPNHCKHLFPSATHRVQLLFSGGVTLDGVHAFWPSMPNPPVVALDGALQPLPAASVLGLADLGTIDQDPYQLGARVLSVTASALGEISRPDAQRVEDGRPV